MRQIVLSETDVGDSAASDLPEEKKKKRRGRAGSGEFVDGRCGVVTQQVCWLVLGGKVR